MGFRYKPFDHKAVFKEVYGQSPRAAITVSGSLVENSLETLISSRLREPTTSKEKEVLFSGFGILGTFSQKIWIAYFMELIGHATRHDLDMIRLIRNICAHEMNPVSFSQPDIAERARSLRFPEELPDVTEPDSLQKRFIVSSQYLCAAMNVKAVAIDSKHKRFKTDAALRALIGYLDE
jgi:hypothetical protein